MLEENSPAVPELEELRSQQITGRVKESVRAKIESKYPEASKIVDLTIELAMIGEKFAALTKIRNDLQDKAGPEINQILERRISDLNKEIGKVIAREDEINAELKTAWLQNKLSNAQEKFPEFDKWEAELMQIAGEERNQEKEKLKNN